MTTIKRESTPTFFSPLLLLAHPFTNKNPGITKRAGINEYLKEASTNSSNPNTMDAFGQDRAPFKKRRV